MVKGKRANKRKSKTRKQSSKRKSKRKSKTRKHSSKKIYRKKKSKRSSKKRKSIKRRSKKKTNRRSNNIYIKKSGVDNTVSKLVLRKFINGRLNGGHGGLLEPYQKKKIRADEGNAKRKELLKLNKALSYLNKRCKHVLDATQREIDRHRTYIWKCFNCNMMNVDEPDNLGDPTDPRLPINEILLQAFPSLLPNLEWPGKTPLVSVRHVSLLTKMSFATPLVRSALEAASDDLTEAIKLIIDANAAREIQFTCIECKYVHSISKLLRDVSPKPVSPTSKNEFGHIWLELEISTLNKSISRGGRCSRIESIKNRIEVIHRELETLDPPSDFS